MSLAISTSWNASLHTSGKDLLIDLKPLGIKDLELSFNLTREMVEEIAVLLSEYGFKVVSVHNYCPIPDGIERPRALPDCYSMTALNEEERRQAIFFTKRSIDTASRLGAQAVILHAGRVEIPDRTLGLIDLFNAGKARGDEYARLKDMMVGEREKNLKPFLDRLFLSLGDLLQYAREKNIKLGIENRYYFREIPSLEELDLVFERFDNLPLFYWHDVGHAQLYENLGLQSHLDYLKRYSRKLLGIHLHDIKGADDHLAPLCGDFDFKKLLPFVKEDTLKVIEAHQPASQDELRSAAKFLNELFKGG